MTDVQSLSECILPSLLTTINDAVSIINTHGKVLYWNEAAEQTYNIKQEQIIGKKIKNFFREEDLMVLKMLHSKQPVQDVYHQPRTDKHVLINSSPIHDNNKQLIGSISIERDITHTVKLNEKLSHTSDELQLLKKQAYLQDGFKNPFATIKGTSKEIKHTIQQAIKVAVTDATVHISGESGVGKELFAQAIHEKSLRREKDFIPINCGAIPHALFESELFGYERGAYSGASKEGKPGKIELANNGTLFLDEIGELPLNMQVKLLRALQEHEIYRIGGIYPKYINVRVIAATNQDLSQMMKEGTFRSDLFYRLNVFPLVIPPLRDRASDIPNLVHDFLNELSKKHYKTPPVIHQDAMEFILSYNWPGNIRELRNLIERLIILSESDEITAANIAHLFPQQATTLQPAPPQTFLDEKVNLEKEHIIETLRETYGNKSATAKILGISRATLYQRIKKYKI